MTQRTWEERLDWVEVNRRTLEMEEVGEDEEKPRKEKDDWGGTGMEGEDWRQKRGNWRVKERRLRRRDFGRLKGGKDGSRGEGRGGVRPG